MPGNRATVAAMNAIGFVVLAGTLAAAFLTGWVAAGIYLRATEPDRVADHINQRDTASGAPRP